MARVRTAFMLIFMLMLLLSMSAVSAQIDSEADFDWDRFAGTELHFTVIQGPWIDSVEGRIAEFEEASGIDVTVEVLPEAQAWDKIRVQMQA